MKINRRQATQAKKRKSGFTLIEVIAVLVLLGILAAIAVPKYIDMADNAKDRALDAGIAELNGREALAWGQQMLATAGYTASSEALIQTAVGSDLNQGSGTDYVLTVSNTTAGTLTFQDYPSPNALSLTRTVSTSTAPATWAR
ncbi:MAG: prepilin-type N-terminal cleavage/methylation domain-containing protein [Akkermansiaceae bacterium]|nr:prepilin-type N-terminal cleavage/methylation domain-containing protein [Akkermansiaceae bacterium]